MQENKNKPKLPVVFIVLTIIGICLIIGGIILTASSCNGIIPDLNTDNMQESFTNTAGSMFGTFAGSVMLMAGFVLTLIGLIPTIKKLSVKTANYVVQETKEYMTQIAETGADIASAGINRMANKSSGAIAKTVGAIKRGLKEDNAETDPQKYCKYCGEQIDADAIFCEKCGKKQD